VEWEDLRMGRLIALLLYKSRSSVKKEMVRKGKFIAATNELDCEKPSGEEVLKAYKEQ